MIRYSQMYRGKTGWYGIEQDFLDGKFKLKELAPLGVFGVFLLGSENSAFILPHAFIVNEMLNSPTNRLHIDKKGEQFFLRVSGKELRDITDYLNKLPVPSGEEPVADPEVPKVEAIDSQEYNIREHTRIQYLLVKFGKAAGYEVWVAPQDKNLSYNKEKFCELCLPELPNFGFDIPTKKIIQNIDVLWIERNIIHKAFEIESTSNVYSGLLRLADLVLSQPNTNIDLNIVAPLARRELVKKNILRPSFQNLRTKCAYISFEEVSKKYEIAKEVLKLQAQLKISLESEKF